MRLGKLITAVFCSILLSACWQVPEQKAISNPSKALIDRGEDLTLGLAACGSCHGVIPSPDSPMAGGRMFTDRYGQVAAANVTASESGIGAWSLTDFIRAIRKDRGPAEEYLSTEFHQGSKWMADDDLAAVFSYLRSLQPVNHQLERRELEFWDRNTTGILESRYKVTGYVPRIKSKDQIRYGAYLVDNVADCGRCHSGPSAVFSKAKYLGGGKSFSVKGEERIAPSLLSDEVNGIGSWSKQDLLAYLKTAVKPQGARADSRFCPVEFYSLAKDEDLQAIAAYLKSLG